MNVNKDVCYRGNYTEYTFQRNNTIHRYGNRRTFTVQNHCFTYQRKGNQELHIHLSSNIVADLQNQINNINTSGSGGGDPNEHEVGTM